MKRKYSPGRLCFLAFDYVIFIAFTLLCLYPFWYILIYSISDPQQVQQGITFFPKGLSFENYEAIFQIRNLGSATVISILKTVFGTCLAVVSSTVLGFVFANPKMPCRKLLYRFLIVTMYVSGGIIANFLVIKSYGLLNTFWVYILPGAVSAFNVVLVKTYIEQIPPALEESALIDGASYPTILARIIFPVCAPIVATVAVFTAVNQWNSWFDTNIYAQADQDLYSLQYLLYRYLSEAQRLADELKNVSKITSASAQMQRITPSGVRMTVTMVITIPIFIVYPFFQRYFTKGIMIGAVKG